MKQLFLIFLVMLGSVSISHYVLKDPGYVLIQFQSWRVESSFITMILTMTIMLLALFLVCHILTRTLKLPLALAHIIKQWQKRRQKKRLKQGIDAFFKGQWTLALKKLKHQPKVSSWPLDLISAQAAQNQGLIKERDQFLQMAALEAPKERETILMFQAQLQLAKAQFEQAQATLTHIRHHAESLSPQWYFMQAELELHFENYQAALDILINTPKLQKEMITYHALFKRSLQGLAANKALPDANALIQLLKKQNPPIQDDFDILLILAPTMKDEKSSRKWLIKKIEAGLAQTSINPKLLAFIAQMTFDAKSYLKYETLLLQQPSSHELFLTLAKMKSKQSLWGAALNYLNQAIKIHPSKEAYTLTAEIYLSLNQNSNALDAMQQALDLS